MLTSRLMWTFDVCYAQLDLWTYYFSFLGRSNVSSITHVEAAVVGEILSLLFARLVTMISWRVLLRSLNKKTEICIKMYKPRVPSRSSRRLIQVVTSSNEIYLTSCGILQQKCESLDDKHFDVFTTLFTTRNNTVIMHITSLLTDASSR